MKITIEIPDDFETLLRRIVREELAAFKIATGNSVGSEPLMTVDQMAAFLDRPKATIYNLVSKREVPHIKKGKRLYFNKADVIAWLNAGKVKTKDEIIVDVNNQITKIHSG